MTDQICTPASVIPPDQREYVAIIDLDALTFTTHPIVAIGTCAQGQTATWFYTCDGHPDVDCLVCGVHSEGHKQLSSFWNTRSDALEDGSTICHDIRWDGGLCTNEYCCTQPAQPRAAA